MLIFIIMIGLAIAGVIVARSQRTYGSSLEQYIMDRNPQHGCDVERLTAEYNMKNRGTKI